jgi:hypothetical protein
MFLRNRENKSRCRSRDVIADAEIICLVRQAHGRWHHNVSFLLQL